MTVDRRDIDTIFLGLLGRLPVDDRAYARAAGAEGIAALARRVMNTPEFRRRLQRAAPLAPPPDLPPCGARRVVFLHVPKCGGSTLHGVLHDWHGAAAVHPERHNGLYGLPAGDLAARTVFAGHFDFYSTGLVPGRRFLVSFLRDPAERLLSLYHFHHAHRADRPGLVLVNLARRLDIDSYFAHPEVQAHPAVNNALVRLFSDRPQRRYRWEAPEPPGTEPPGTEPPGTGPAGDDGTLGDLCRQALRNLSAFGFIGFVEEYETSVARLGALLGKPPVPRIARRQVLDDLMVSHPDLRPVARQDPAPGTLGRIAALTRWDRVLHDAARAAFPSSPDLPPAFPPGSLPPDLPAGDM